MRAVFTMSPVLAVPAPAPGGAAAPFFQARDLFLVPIDPGVLVIASPGEPDRTEPLAGGQVIFLPGGKARSMASSRGVVRGGGGAELGGTIGGRGRRPRSTPCAG